MDRLTIPDKPIEGGMRRAMIDARAVREEAMRLYWRLKAYEDTGLEPGDMQNRYKKMQELLERAAEEIENCYGRETELSKNIRKHLN